MTLQNDRVKDAFLAYLDGSGVSKNTLKFYSSDLNNFIAWLVSEIGTVGGSAQSLTEAIPYLNPAISEAYKQHLLKANIPVSTLNRRLSAVRRLSSFLALQGKTTDFAENLVNVSVNQNKHSGVPSANFELVMSLFEKYLEEEKVSRNTLRNYMVDIRQFVSFLEANYAADNT